MQDPGQPAYLECGKKRGWPFNYWEKSINSINWELRDTWSSALGGEEFKVAQNLEEGILGLKKSLGIFRNRPNKPGQHEGCQLATLGSLKSGGGVGYFHARLGYMENGISLLGYSRTWKIRIGNGIVLRKKTKWFCK